MHPKTLITHRFSADFDYVTLEKYRFKVSTKMFDFYECVLEEHYYPTIPPTEEMEEEEEKEAQLKNNKINCR